MPAQRELTCSEAQHGASPAWAVGGFGRRSRLRHDDPILRRARPRRGDRDDPAGARDRVDLLDTADGYGRGRNEELVAEAVRGHRGDYVIASKFGNLGLLGDPRFADGRPEYVHEACEKSLGRLRTDVIDLYYIHRVDPTVPIEDTIGAMSALVW